MLEAIREVELTRNASRRTVRELRELVHVTLVPCPEEQELGVEREIIVVAEDEIEALLIREARAHREDRNIATLLEPERSLDRRLALLLDLERVSRVVRRDLFVRRWIPHPLVDAVHDADKTIA